MHKGIICLIRATGRNDALQIVIEFLNLFEGNVFDWYQIGGRWTQTLSPYYKQFKNHVEHTLPHTRGSLLQKTVDKYQSQLQHY